MANEIKGVSGIDKAVSALITELKEGCVEDINRAKELSLIVTTPENSKDRKKDRAEINALFTKYDKIRKGLKSSWTKALDPVNDAYLEVTGELTKCLAEVDKQLKEVEEARIAEKRKQITDVFNAVDVPERITGWLTLDKVFDPLWMNVGCPLSRVKSEIEKSVKELDDAYEMILDQNCPYEEEGLRYLRKTGSYFEAQKRMNQLVKDEELRKEAMERAERQRIEREERARLAEEKRAREEAERKAREAEEAENRRLFLEAQKQKAQEAVESVDTNAAVVADPFTSEPTFVATNIKNESDPVADKIADKLTEEQNEVIETICEEEEAVCFRAWLTPTKAALLAEFLHDNSIRFEAI